MQLFVANTTKQHHDFTYRLPEDKNTRMETIKAGTQLAVGGDLPSNIVAEIIKQHAPYGLRDANELSRLDDYVGLCYNIGKPVPLENMLFLFDSNDKQLDSRAVERRETEAVAIAQTVETMGRETGTPVRRTEIETQESTVGGAEPKLNSGIEVPREGVPPRHLDTDRVRVTKREEKRRKRRTTAQ